MKDLIVKYIVLKIIQILILSQVVFAQSLDDESFREEFSDDDEFKIKFNDDSGIVEIRQEFKDSDERYEFRERREFGPDFGPEYENKEEMLFGRLFHLIGDDISEFEMLKLCGEPEKIADITIGKVKAKIGDISNACSDIEEQEIECKKRVEDDCARIGQPDLRFARDEREKKEMRAYACPPNKDLIVELCVDNSREWIDNRLNYLQEDCRIEWERYGGANDPECKRLEREQFCDESKFIEQCLKRYEPFDIKCPDIRPPECPNGNLENKYDDRGCLIGYSCIEFEKQCPEVYEPVCGNDGVTYYNSCKAEKAGVGFTSGECRKCPITEEDALRKENDCFRNNGNPERVYDGECIIEVKCNVKPQCPITNEETERLYNDCLAKNGNPEKVWDGECVTDVLCHIDTSNGNDSITGNVVGISGAFTYEEAKRQCKNEWNNQQDYCHDLNERCDKDNFVGQCIAREKKNIEFSLEDSKRQCERDANMQIRHQERECSRMDAERERCFEQGSRQCERMEGLASECHATVTEENFRAFIIREAKKNCKFVPFIKKKEDFEKYEKMEIVLAVSDTIGEEEITKLKSIVENLERKFELDGKIIFEGVIDPNRFVDIKRLNFVVNAKLNAPESSDVAKERKLEIISRIDPKRVVEKLLELRDTDISSEYKYLVEDRASDLLEASNEIGELEEKEEGKGIGYKIRLFLGLAKDIEEGEIQSLERSKQRLETSIATLSKLVGTVPDDIAKAILKAQVEDLERQKADMDDLIEQKKKKAKGLLGLFGLFG